jgi:hypothetical protein
MKIKYYTGVGSRNISKDEQDFIRDVAYKLRCKGWFLRSGAADGADSAFWDGHSKFYRETHEHHDRDHERIYLPWDGFQGYHVDSPMKCFYTPKILGVEKQAREIAMDVHPASHKLTRGPLAMHTRNVLQVLGDNLKSPSTFLIACSDPIKGGVTGGTNTAVQLAIRNNVPWYNIRVKEDKERLERWLYNGL